MSYLRALGLKRWGYAFEFGGPYLIKPPSRSGISKQLACRSLNQNLPSVLDVDSRLGGQRGEAAAGEVKEITIYECTIF